MEKKKTRMGKKTLILIIISCVLIPVVAFSSYFAYLLYFRKNSTFIPVSGDASPDVKPLDIPSDEQSGVDNIVLFGVDNRTPNDHGRTDSIIIATVDKNNKVIKLSSIMRDLYVPIGSTKSMNRINSAYAIGGPDLALKTINNNFGLDLKYYAIIDFMAFQDLVDKMDGIDVDVKDYELEQINYYIKSVNGSKATLLTKPGYQHLNGQQALSYARIRHVGNGDYERTERQRTVLKCLAEKAKQTSLVKLPQLLTTLASYVQTNVPMSKIISLGTTAYGFKSSIETMRIPVDGYFEGQNVNGASVLVPDITANAQLLKEFIYNVKYSGSKDVPSYMQNDFHANDGVSSSKPKANIPDYSTPNIPLKPDSEQSLPMPSTTPTPSVTKTPGVSPTVTPGTEVTPTPTGTPSVTPKPTETPTPEPTKAVTPTPAQN